MNAKTIQLTSSGLKNIVLNEKEEKDEFYFVFDQEEIKTNKIHAEFISPTISHLHLIDPTINRYSIGTLLNQFEANQFTNSSKSSNELKDVQKVTIKLLEMISRGQQISINDDEIFPLKILSILLGNEELFEMVEKSFPNTKIAPEQETEEEIKTHIKEIMRELEIIDKIKKGSNNNINYSKLFDYISYHMSYINIEDLRKMSPTFFYELLKN